jgi:hypothetical protein
MTIRRFNVAVEGVSPLLLSNNLCSDPLSQAAKDKKYFTSKNKKGDTDHQNLRLIDWVHSGYWSKPGEVVIDEKENEISFAGFEDLTLPSQNFARCLRNGATAFRLGKEINRALIVENEPLIDYEGPKTANQMVSDKRFFLTSPVVRMKVTNWVTRLILPKWGATYQVTVDDERISIDDLERIAKTAGRFEGLGTWRPRYGRFRATLNEIDVVEAAA